MLFVNVFNEMFKNRHFLSELVSKSHNNDWVFNYLCMMFTLHLSHPFSATLGFGATGGAVDLSAHRNSTVPHNFLLILWSDMVLLRALIDSCWGRNKSVPLLLTSCRNQGNTIVDDNNNISLHYRHASHGVYHSITTCLQQSSLTQLNHCKFKTEATMMSN